MRLRTLSGAVVLSLALAAPASAASLLPPTDLAASPRNGSASCDLTGFEFHPAIAAVDVASSDAGETVVAWTRNDGAGGQVVEAAFRPPGGAFSPPQTVGRTQPCYALGILGATPEVGIDARGNAAVVFPAAAANGRTVIRGAVRPAGGAFGTAVELSSSASDAEGSHLAMGADGTAVAVWSRPDGGRFAAEVATLAPGAGRFGSPVRLSAAGRDARFARVAVNAAGAAAVAWAGGDDAAPTGRVAQVRVQPAGSPTFAAAQSLSRTADAADGPDVVLDGAGRATVAWVAAAGSRREAQSRFTSAAGVVAGFGVDTISDSGVGVEAVRLAVDPGGSAVAVFKGCPLQAACQVQAAARAMDGTFGTVQPVVDTNGLQVLPRVVVDPAGTATMVFSPGTTGGPAMFARRPAGGAFGDVQPVSPSGASAFVPDLAVDGEGNVVVAWTAGASAFDGAKVAQVRAFDAAGPSLGAVDVPATATAERTVRMSATAGDRWSGATITWNFGDGTSGNGAAVDHAYPLPGVYTVTTTATDGAGNATSVARTIQVAERDGDGDGFPASQDCDDGNAARRPGAPEIAGDGVDQNCDGRDQPLPIIGSPVQSRWGVAGRKLFLLRLRVVRPPAGATARLTCDGKLCPFRARTATKVLKGAITLFGDLKARKAARKRARRFHAGQKLELRITARGFVGKSVRFKLQKGRIPAGRISCVQPGAKRPGRC